MKANKHYNKVRKWMDVSYLKGTKSEDRMVLLLINSSNWKIKS